MKVLIFEKTGLQNLQVRDVEKPAVGPDAVLVKVKMAGVNPIDFRVVDVMPTVKPMPHIPGAEFAGVVDEIGSHVSTLKRGDRVTVYNRVAVLVWHWTDYMESRHRSWEQLVELEKNLGS